MTAPGAPRFTYPLPGGIRSAVLTVELDDGETVTYRMSPGAMFGMQCDWSQPPLDPVLDPVLGGYDPPEPPRLYPVQVSFAFGYRLPLPGVAVVREVRS